MSPLLAFSPWLALYTLTGPLFAALLVIVTLLGRRRLDRLIQHSRRWRSEGGPTLDRDNLPRVTVVIPVKDEAGGIEQCVRTLLNQDYPNLDVLVIDDRSTDGTREILARLAGEVGKRLRVQHIDRLADGWLGKPHALHHGVTDAGDNLGDWLVFVDSDVQAATDAVSHCMALALERNYHMVSLLTGLIAPTLIEKLVTPTAAAVWMVVFKAAHTNNDNRTRYASANGQYLMIRRDILAEIGGHAAVRDKTCEDVELARLVKTQGREVRFFVGRHLAWTRMHSTWPQLYNGWARNFAGSARHRRGPIAAGLLGLLSLAQWPMALGLGAFLRDPFWLALGGLHLAIVLVWFSIVYLAAFTPTRGDKPEDTATRLGLIGCVALASIHLVPVLLTSVLMLNAIRVCRGGRVMWRGSLVRA